MRTHRAERRRQAGGALAHLLLVVVLALGVFLMHTLGHPEGSGGGSHHTTAATAPAAHDGGDSDASHGPGTSTDMSTLCVAVLGVWLLARLVLAALGHGPERLVPFLARLAHVRAPHAPPRRPPDLTLLSLLRI
ncbi:DUF6153 family protein [Streptomyces sp. CS081A]|uniref:DUF6153 family protein n=1 Tax=Streptomyces sp. CS081A TaxID=2162709 RepID=UPI000D524005|nr:DUF6153 family protein [Streptomyces sp. CS081A]PVC76188.1 hypothetical protein DBP18_05475 [Streptomyces sp. CS081A]